MPQLATPAVHAVHARQLQEVMTDLYRFEFEDMPQELGGPVARRRHARRIAAAAGRMAEAADRIPDALTEVRLTTHEHDLFLSLAERLRGESLSLQSAAAAQRMDDVRRHMDAVLGTCNACHAAFRPPSTSVPATR